MTVQRTKQPKNNTHNTSVFWDVTPIDGKNLLPFWKT